MSKRFKINQPPGAIGGIDLPVIQPAKKSRSYPIVTTFEASDPRDLVKAYHDEYERHRDTNKTHDDSHRRALRLTQNMGWQKTKDGWKKVGPDISKKVMTLDCVEQPDGRFYIAGVPCFYPNAVKGKDLAFSRDDIRQIISNSNEHDAPAVIIEGHPNSEAQGAMGMQQDAQGFVFNWREYPNSKKCLVLCDFRDVPQSYVKRLQEKKLPYLSVGFAKDRHGNRRFGHVALLGGTSPALPYLPPTDFFSVSGNYVCFSADMEFFPRKEKHMLSQKQKDCYAAMTSAYEAYDAAEKSKELGQPDFESRMDEAYKAFMPKAKEFASEMGGSMADMPPTVPGDMPPDDTTGAFNAEENIANDGMVPAETPMGSQTPTFASIEDIKAHFSNPAEDNNPALAFNALADRFEQAMQVIKVLRTKDAANTNRQRWHQFSVETTALRKSGRPLPSDEYLKEQFDATFESKDPDKAQALILKGYKSMPAQLTPATFAGGHPVFDASHAKPHLGKATAKLTAGDLVGVMPSLSKQDLEFAALSEAFNE